MGQSARSSVLVAKAGHSGIEHFLSLADAYHTSGFRRVGSLKELRHRRFAMTRHNHKAKIVTTLVLLAGTALASAARPETFTKIDVPGAAVTVASGINNDGFIVGWYCVQAPCNPALLRGFLRGSGGTFHDIVVPATSDHPAIGTQARYISPQG